MQAVAVVKECQFISRSVYYQALELSVQTGGKRGFLFIFVYQVARTVRFERMPILFQPPELPGIGEILARKCQDDITLLVANGNSFRERIRAQHASNINSQRLIHPMRDYVGGLVAKTFYHLKQLSFGPLPGHLCD